MPEPAAAGGPAGTGRGRGRQALARTLLTLATVATWAGALALEPTDLPPQMGQRAQGQLAAYAAAAPPKAFALASDGAWAWVADQVDQGGADDAALARCDRYARQRCLVFARGDRVVLDPARWHASWTPEAAVDAAVNGVDPGQLFPDLVFRDADAQPRRLSELRGQVVLVHFWGSWCPPCMREFPSLQRLVDRLQARAGVAVVMLQVREPFARALAWAEAGGFGDLPLFDSGVDGEDDDRLRLASGGHLADRVLAPAFPASYVLDAQGRVVFARTGPVEDWTAYLPFFDHLLATGATARR